MDLEWIKNMISIPFTEIILKELRTDPSLRVYAKRSLDKWRELSPSASVLSLVSGLKRIKRSDIAKKIEQQLLTMVCKNNIIEQRALDFRMSGKRLPRPLLLLIFLSMINLLQLETEFLGLVRVRNTIDQHNDSIPGATISSIIPPISKSAAYR